MKGFNVSFEYVLYEMSFVNVRMYSSVLPTYGGKKDRNDSKGFLKPGETVINGDDPSMADKIDKILG